MMSLESVTDTIKTEGIEFVRFEFSDFYGISRCKVIPARHFVEKASHGIAIPLCHLSCSIDGKDPLADTPYGNGGEIGLGDGLWFPDLNTFRVLPWYRKTGSIQMEPRFYKGEPVSCYPRFIARRQLERLNELGIFLLAAHEQEFYVVDGGTQKPLTQDTCFRSTLRTYTDPNLLDELMTSLYKAGIDVENYESEGGTGQFEITYKPAFGIKAADNAQLFKTSVKEIAQQQGYVASFMSKPYADQMGSSAHFCHSLWDKDAKTNLLYDASAENKLSDLGRHWMAGILEHSQAITILMAPTVNCYRRFGKQSYVSQISNWGIDNRCCLLRLKINGANGAYIENRGCGGGSNPYLTLAAVIAAGVDGIEKKLPLPEEEIGDPFRKMDSNCDKNMLPSSLSDALDAFQADDVIAAAFGDDFFNVFNSLKKYEIRSMKSADCNTEESSFEWDRKMFFKYL